MILAVIAVLMLLTTGGAIPTPPLSDTTGHAPPMGIDLPDFIPTPRFRESLGELAPPPSVTTPIQVIIPEDKWGQRPTETPQYHPTWVIWVVMALMFCGGVALVTLYFCLKRRAAAQSHQGPAEGLDTMALGPRPFRHGPR